MRLGADVDLSTLLDKLDKKFASMTKGQHIMREFYAAQQRDDEDVSSWGCRLEDLLFQAKDSKHIDEKEWDELLREQFWTGLREDLQEGTEYKYDAVEDFDDLMEAIRHVEMDRKLKPSKGKCSSKSGAVKMQVPVTGKSELEELRDMFKQMNKKIDGLQEEMQRMKGPSQPQVPASATSQAVPQIRKCYNCGDPSHIRPDCPHLQSAPQVRKCYNCGDPSHIRPDCPHPPSNRNRGRGRGRGRAQGEQTSHLNE